MFQNIDFKESLKFAGVYISVLIGSGFATGQEILQFFSSHGIMSVVSVVMSIILMSYLGSTLFVTGKNHSFETSNEIFTYLGGNLMRTVFKIFIPIFMISVFAVMVSGAGASMKQYYNLPTSLGSIVMGILALVSVWLGITKLINILGRIGPIIAIVSVLIGGITLFHNIENLATVSSEFEHLHLIKAGYHWSITPFIYCGLNAVLATPFLIGASKEANNPKSLVWGGIIGGVLFGLAILSLNLGILSDITSIATEPIPTLFMANNISKLIGFVFSIMLIAGIYTTAAPLLWTLCDTFAKEGTMRYRLVAVVSVIIGLIGGTFLPFAKLVNLIYPASGALGVWVLLSLCFLASQPQD